MHGIRVPIKMEEKGNKVRIDKWLWAARFFKTRSLAKEAVSGGRVYLNGTRMKPAREIHVGDQINIRRGPYEWTVVVRGLSLRRGTAGEAVSLYDETEESKRNREETVAEIRTQEWRPPHTRGRPSKKDRRDLTRFRSR